MINILGGVVKVNKLIGGVELGAWQRICMHHQMQWYAYVCVYMHTLVSLAHTHTHTHRHTH